MPDRPYWYEINGMIVCQDCRKRMLEEWAPGTVKWGADSTPHTRDADGYVRDTPSRPIEISEDETVRPRDFEPLGRTPWAGNPPGDRYMQCDNCNGQWGPDA